MAISCAGCRQKINSKLFLKCYECKDNYDLECANVPEKRFFNTMTKEHKSCWKCPLCRAKKPKTDNNNTPVRQYHQTDPSSSSSSSSLQLNNQENVTLRTKRKEHRSLDSSNEEDSMSLEGDTLIPDSPQIQTYNESHDNNVSQKPPRNLDETITIEKFSLLLQKNNDEIVKKLKNLIHEQIASVVQKWEENFKKSTQTISLEQSKIKKDIATLDSRIKTLTERCSELQAENENMQKEMSKLLETHITPEIYETSRKSFVLHGLQEQHWENEEDVENRIINIFHDVLNINLTGYIEQISYIGNKKSYRRPIKVELISKKMSTYIVENSIYFKDAGLSVTEYLSKTALKERKNLKQALYEARKNGHYAVIRNGKLFVDPKNNKEKIYSQENNHHNVETSKIRINNSFFRD